MHPAMNLFLLFSSDDLNTKILQTKDSRYTELYS